MTWVTWVTWGFVAVAAGVVMIAAFISRGSLDSSFENPYQPAKEAAPESLRPGAHSSALGSDIEWSEPAAWRPHLDEDAVSHPQPHPRTTGEPAHGRHEAQDR